VLEGGLIRRVSESDLFRDPGLDGVELRGGIGQGREGGVVVVDARNVTAIT
jgi:hypothetical protein